MKYPTRRQFVQGVGVAGLALVAGCGRLPWQAQPRAMKVYRVGFVTIGTDPAELDSNLRAFRQGLGEHGWVEGDTVVIEPRFAQGREESYPTLMTELTSLPVDVIVTASSPAIRAAMEATTSIPIVFAAAGDPVGTGLVASLAHPGGNVTGLTIIGPQLGGKQLQLLTETAPGISRVAAFYTPTTAGWVDEMQTAAPTLKVQLQPIALRTADDLAGAFAAAANEGAEGLVMTSDALLNAHHTRIVDFATRNRLPMIAGTRPFVTAGALMVYGPDTERNFRRAATYVDKILKGAKPADLPIERPMTFDFVINLRTAQALGLTIPQHVLLQATEVLQ
jgi:putative ABC transport system substrate-binding protein